MSTNVDDADGDSLFEFEKAGSTVEFDGGSQISGAIGGGIRIRNRIGQEVRLRQDDIENIVGYLTGGDDSGVREERFIE